MIIDDNNVLYQPRRLVRGIFGQKFGTTFREIKAGFKILTYVNQLRSLAALLNMAQCDPYPKNIALVSKYHCGKFQNFTIKCTNNVLNNPTIAWHA